MRVVFIGTGEIGVPVLRWLRNSPAHQLVGVVTQPDKPVGRDQRIQAPPIKAVFSGADLPILQPARIKREDVVAEIRALQPEVIVVMAYGQILPRSVLEIPSIACLNLHASLLPRHRGAAPIQAAILAGDAETGITVMYMDEGLDTGDMLLKSSIALGSDETGGSLHDKLAEISPSALAEALSLLAGRNAPRTPQDAAAATYAPKLEREDGLIDWSDPAVVIARKMRAFDPWPGTYAIVQEPGGTRRKLKLFNPVAVVDNPNLAAGQIIAGDATEMLVGAGDGAVRICEAQLEGRKRLTSAELLRGAPWLSGSTGC